MVRSETPRIAAISTNEKPQKNFSSMISASAGSISASSSSASLMPISACGPARLTGVVGVERRDMEQPASLLRSPATHVVDDQAAHDPRRIAHEPRVIDEDRAVLAGDRQVGLVQQRRHAEPAERAAAVQFPACQPMQLRVQRHEQRVGRLAFVDVDIESVG